MSSLSPATVLAEAARLEGAGEPFVLCTVVDTSRSAPRDGGARMVVRQDGTIAGTVGGGPLEAAVVGEALGLLARAEAGPLLFEATLTTTGEVHLGMKCGGEVRVLLDPVRPGARLVVFGAGHVGLKVAEVALLAEWRVVVADDRPERLQLVPEGAGRERFEADRPETAARLVGPGDFAVILTRCHDIDERLLKATLATGARYVGLIGSKRKAAVIFRNLRRDAGVDPSRDGRVYSPVGLDVGSKRPGEIAISVMAELLAVRDGREARHRRLPPRGEGVEAEAESAPALAADRST